MNWIMIVPNCTADMAILWGLLDCPRDIHEYVMAIHTYMYYVYKYLVSNWLLSAAFNAPWVADLQWA